MIRVRGLHHSLGGAEVLRGLDLDLPRHGLTALIGPNGAGKSTLLHLVARQMRVQRGRIEVDGLDVARTPGRVMARHLAILAQRDEIAARLTVAELVGYGRWPHHRGRPGPKDEAARDAALAAFDLRTLADRHLDELSGGQRRRALVAMAVAQGTPWLLLDEPLAALDPGHAQALMARLHAMSRPGTPEPRAVVAVLHDVNHAAAWADRVVALKGGRVLAEGPPEAVLTPATLRTLYGVDARPVPHGRRFFVPLHGGPG